ncbi:ABCA9 protein, partial [Melanocharis versteri]|nr:ABCA9 protein [Melanocharis versteri]
ALVDIPFYWSLMCLMFGLLVLLTHYCPLEASSVLTLLVCIFGYGISLVLFVYLMSFKFRMGRSNRYIWSLTFILVSEEHLCFEMFDSHTLPLGALFQIYIDKFQLISIF